jgi:hypothetical protein
MVALEACMYPLEVGISCSCWCLKLKLGLSVTLKLFDTMF